MTALAWVTHHRLWALGIGAVLVIVGAAAAAWFIVLRSPATKVDLHQALSLYRREQRAPAAGSTRIPPPGVYRYRGSGGEQLSIDGIHRSFPSATEMIVTDAGCAKMEWEPFVQHMEGLVECPRPAGALAITSALSYEQIAGTQTTSVIHCPPHTYLVPPSAATGSRWHSTCHGPGETVGFTGEVIGPSSVDIGGNRVAALHTRLTLTFSGSESGSNPNDYWVSVQNGMILRQRETVDVSQSAGPLGSVRYTEQMAIALTSTTPAR